MEAGRRTRRRWLIAAASGLGAATAVIALMQPPEQRSIPGVVVAEEPTRSQPAPTKPGSATIGELSQGLRSAPTPIDFEVDPVTRVGDAPAVANQLIVTYTPKLSAAERASTRTSLGVRLVSSLRGLDSDVVSFTGRTMAEVRRAASAHSNVVYAEPNYIYSVQDTTPNDPAFKQLWGLENSAQTILGVTGVADADVDAAEAWDTTTNAGNVVVGVVDTGLDARHVDLAPNSWTNPGEMGDGKESNGIDDDNNGYVDDWRGWDWVDDDNDASDLHGHGTHVAGTIGAQGGDGVGITGVNWSVALAPLRVLGANGSGTTADTAAAFAYAGKMGIPVVNASLGGGGFSQTLSDTIARYPDTLYVVAAGNDGKDNDSAPQYPCNYEAANVVCVASTTNTDQLSSFSNYGARSVDIAAPGSGILSTVPAFTEPFADEFETDLADRWTGTGDWGRDQDGAGSFLADSPGSGYVGGADSHIATQAPIDLSEASDCRLRYDLRLAIAEDRDALRIEASGDASSWQPIANWSGSTSTRWVSMNEPLGGFAGASTVFIRFRLTTSDGSSGSGADIDNVRIRCLSPASSARYAYFSGTSMASPHVAGAAALVWASIPDPSASRVKTALLAGGDPQAHLAGKVTSGTRLNIARALVVAGAVTDKRFSPSPTPSVSIATKEATKSPLPSPSPSGVTASTPPSPPSSPSAPATPTPPPMDHDRTLSLRLRGELVAKGSVATTDGFGPCENRVPVKVLRNGQPVARTQTNSDGSYRVRLRNRSGRYRAIATRVIHDNGGLCVRASSHGGMGMRFRADSADGEPAKACATYTDTELAIAAELDRARVDADLPKLALDGAISAVAGAHNDEMLGVGTVFNIDGDALREQLVGWDAVGQNVASGPDAYSLFESFLQSDLHRDTILDHDYERMGLDIERNESRAWLTILFVSENDPREVVSACS